MPVVPEESLDKLRKLIIGGDYHDSSQIPIAFQLVCLHLDLEEDTPMEQMNRIIKDDFLYTMRVTARRQKTPRLVVLCSLETLMMALIYDLGVDATHILT
jgi:hypothetical protein